MNFKDSIKSSKDFQQFSSFFFLRLRRRSADERSLFIPISFFAFVFHALDHDHCHQLTEPMRLRIKFRGTEHQQVPNQILSYYLVRHLFDLTHVERQEEYHNHLLSYRGSTILGLWWVSPLLLSSSHPTAVSFFLLGCVWGRQLTKDCHHQHHWMCGSQFGCLSCLSISGTDITTKDDSRDWSTASELIKIHEPGSMEMERQRLLENHLQSLAATRI